MRPNNLDEIHRALCIVSVLTAMTCESAIDGMALQEIFAAEKHLEQARQLLQGKYTHPAKKRK